MIIKCLLAILHYASIQDWLLAVIAIPLCLVALVANKSVEIEGRGIVIRLGSNEPPSLPPGE